MSVEIDITYEGDLHCRATHAPSRRTLRTDAPVDNGGHGDEFSPTDLVATAAGTCVMTILGLAARADGLDLTGTRAHVVKEMTADPVRRIEKIGIDVTLPAGVRATETQRRKLEQAAKHCPVKQSLHPDVDVAIRFVWP